MKKKLLFLLPFLLFSLTACDLSSLANQFGNDDESSEKEDEEGQGEPLKTNKEQTFNKLKEFGKTTGFDITSEVKSSDQQDVSSVEVAMKGNKVWLISEHSSYSGIQLNNDSITAFASDDGVTFEKNEIGQEELDGKTPEEFFDDYLETITSWLYFSDNGRSLGLTKVRDFTYVGRAATEYAMSLNYGTASMNYKAYIDKELGITLYWFGEATSPEEGTDSSEFKVTSFKYGDQVVAPNIQ